MIEHKYNLSFKTYSSKKSIQICRRRERSVQENNCLLAAMPAAAVVMTMEVAPGAAEVAVISPTDAVPARLFAGVAVVAKNPAG